MDASEAVDCAGGCDAGTPAAELVDAGAAAACVSTDAPAAVLIAAMGAGAAIGGATEDGGMAPQGDANVATGVAEATGTGVGKGAGAVACAPALGIAVAGVAFVDGA